ncbi:hypothetical protein [Nocardia sp. NRRL S-836]|uniref:hypothetical protein n=1 Tax=Nocardia sp. NRRL S-836 TaxID=1519492 RepID=UPI0006AE185C|nr:hypothetical protein [Nocardia sp. NRRL S-836]KOV80860.1 hypothetical protein ADL03_31245 [Nocardia sp. NRRL S-836]
MVEPITPLTPRPVRFASVGQWWRDVTSVHWAVAPFLAAHTRPDVLDGRSSVGLVPLRVHAGVVAAAGLGAPTGPPASVPHSPGVPVRSGVPAAVGRF